MTVTIEGRTIDKMKLRRRGANVGTYVDPPVRPVAPVERVVEDGVVISTAAVKMVVKNHIIVAALRDHLDFDIQDLADVARAEFVQLARENEETADRLESEPDDTSESPGPDNASKARRREEHVRRPEVHRLLGAALREASEDDDATEDLVIRARDDAADEIGREVSTQLLAHQFEPEPDYDDHRAERLRDFVDIDLATLLEPAPSAGAKSRRRWGRIR